MKVKDLIANLKQYHPDLEVVACDQYGDITTVDEVSPIKGHYVINSSGKLEHDYTTTVLMMQT